MKRTANSQEPPQQGTNQEEGLIRQVPKRQTLSKRKFTDSKRPPSPDISPIPQTQPMPLEPETATTVDMLDILPPATPEVKKDEVLKPPPAPKKVEPTRRRINRTREVNRYRFNNLLAHLRNLRANGQETSTIVMTMLAISRDLEASHAPVDLIRLMQRLTSMSSNFSFFTPAQERTAPIDNQRRKHPKDYVDVEEEEESESDSF